MVHDKLLKTAEVMTLLNVGRDAVLKLVEDGKLKATKLGPKTIRIFQSSVDSLIEEGLNL